MMDATAIQALRDLVEEAEARLVDAPDGRTYSTRPLHPLPRLSMGTVPTLKVGTLRAVMDYLQSAMVDDLAPLRVGLDELESDGLPFHPPLPFVHIEGPRRVRILSPLVDPGGANLRHVYLEATPDVDDFPWGIYRDTEELLIELMTRFHHSPDLEYLQSTLRHVVHEESVITEDDGLSQTLTVRKGRVRVGTEAARNIVSLRPVRSFPEIDQPESKFLVRYRGGGKDGPVRVTLLEADGGAWELEARESIREYLRGGYDDGPPVRRIIG